MLHCHFDCAVSIRRLTRYRGGGCERDYIGMGEDQENNILEFGVPRQCPLVLLVWVKHMIRMNITKAAAAFRRS
jgi:hypothetical protein